MRKLKWVTFEIMLLCFNIPCVLPGDLGGKILYLNLGFRYNLLPFD